MELVARRYIGTDGFTNAVWLWLNHLPHDKCSAILMLGWAAGMYSASVQGEVAVKAFAKVNAVPLALWVFTNISTNAAIKTTVIPGVLLATFGCIGFL